jgi:hypothetical protein
MYEEREYNDDEQVNIYYVSEDFINNHLYNLNLLSIQETFQLIYNYDKIFSSENLYEYFDNTPELSKIIRKYSIEVKEFYQTNTSSDTFLIEPDSSLRPNPGFKNTIELKTPYGFTLKE